MARVKNLIVQRAANKNSFTTSDRQLCCCDGQTWSDHMVFPLLRRRLPSLFISEDLTLLIYLKTDCVLNVSWWKSFIYPQISSHSKFSIAYFVRYSRSLREAILAVGPLLAIHQKRASVPCGLQLLPLSVYMLLQWNWKAQVPTFITLATGWASGLVTVVYLEAAHSIASC